LNDFKYTSAHLMIFIVVAPIFVRSLLQVIPLDLLEIGINDYLSK